MSNVTVCVRFRPLSHKERKANGDNVCFKRLDSESFVLKVWTLSILLLP
jgi:kinesin family member 5